MENILVALMYFVPAIAIWAVKILILYFVLKTAFYHALVKFHDTHGFFDYAEEPEPAEYPPEAAPEEPR